MTRTLTAIAAAIFAGTAFFAQAAQACVSCEYVPPVVNTPVYSHGGGHYSAKRVYKTVKRKVRPVKRIVDVEDKAPVKSQAKAQVKAETVETADTAPVESEAESENSSISTASVDKSESADAARTKAKPIEEAKVSKNVGCKKFFPTVGMTLTVPCE